MSIPHNPATLQEASISWDQYTPKSEAFDDIYFSKQDGQGESEYVFVDANDVSARLRACKDGRFTIFETGFGTGLNFLNTLKAWDKSSEPGASLTFISVEKYPLKLEDLSQALAGLDEFKDDLRYLEAHYPLPTKGSKYLYFRNGKVKLHLIWGDVEEALRDYCFSIDCWYLDGFNPAQNEAMWSQSVFNMMAAKSNPGATFSTFTVAGFVRRGLIEAGFTVSKYPGFGRKREMLVGKLEQTRHPQHCAHALPRWSNTDQHTALTQHAPEHHDIAIIGAGIAGLNTALACAKQGLSCLLIDRADSATQGASGQPYLTTYSKLPAEWSREARLSSFMLEFSQRHYSRLQNESATSSDDPEKFWDPCGQLQLDWSHQEALRSEKKLKEYALPDEFVRRVNKDEASELSGTRITQPGWWYPNSGALNPSRFARFVLAQNNIDAAFGQTVSRLEMNASENRWYIVTDKTVIHARAVVLCNSFEAVNLDQSAHLPLKKIRGQTSLLAAGAVPSLKSIICGEGYLYCDEQGQHHIGSTYDLNHHHCDISEEDHESNLNKLLRWLPGWINETSFKDALSGGTAGIRGTTPDYTPIVGPAPVFEEMKARFSKLREDATTCKEKSGAYYTHLYLNVGHGSKGLVSSVAAGEHIASLISGDSSPLSAEAIQMMHPSRFIIKQLIKGKL